MPAQPRVCLVSASEQNVYFGEILEALGAALGECGLTVEESVDCFPAPADDLVYLFVPHEYQPLVHELAHPSPDQLRRSVAVCTEQPGTQWFETATTVAGQAGAAVDINTLGVEELARRGIAAEHAPLGYVRGWDAWGGGEDGERPIDLAFLGGYTDRRGKVLAGCAEAMEGRRSAIHLTETFRPHVAGNPKYLAGEAKWRTLAECKVILNVHRDELAYMEWHRLIGAMLNGCVVLSEHSLGLESLVAGEHFASADYRDLPMVLEALLDDDERLSALRHAAYDLLRERMPAEETSAGLLRAIERAAENELPKRPATDRPRPAPMPMPNPPPALQPGWEAHVEHAGESRPLRAAVKHLVLHARAVERRLESLAEAVEGTEDRVERFGPDQDPPRVSVLLTLHNYADCVGEALRSVALQDLRKVEVVVVDDASTDDSVEAVRAACAELPWLAVTLVRRARNGGLPAARNLALEHAQADLLFILDADNSVMPKGIRVLVEALDARPDAAFAYGIIETFDASGPLGLMNWLEWDRERLRHGNYIDAMSMIRRAALAAVGGYPTDPALYGWEDFGVWVAMADAGFDGVRVPDFVARYRRSPHSMLSLADVDSSAAWATLLHRFPSLAKPQPH